MNTTQLSFTRALLPLSVVGNQRGSLELAIEAVEFNWQRAEIMEDSTTDRKLDESAIEDLFISETLDIDKVLKELHSVGATSVRILNEKLRLALLEEAEGYAYKQEQEVVGSAQRTVKQQVSSFTDFPQGSRCFLLRDAFENLLKKRLSEVKSCPLREPLCFNSMVLQRYEKGSIGITPHKDGKSFINLVCIFNIGGKGSFYVCSDRSGSNAREIDASEGRVTIMRAPGLFGFEDGRPFHYASDIQNRRYTFGLRQKVT